MFENIKVADYLCTFLVTLCTIAYVLPNPNKCVGLFIDIIANSIVFSLECVLEKGNLLWELRFQWRSRAYIWLHILYFASPPCIDPKLHHRATKRK